jgi:hypothetical protein
MLCMWAVEYDGINPINLIDRDTLTTVGLVVPLSLPPACVEVNTTTRVFRQALSLDEVCSGCLVIYLLDAFFGIGY